MFFSWKHSSVSKQFLTVVVLPPPYCVHFAVNRWYYSLGPHAATSPPKSDGCFRWPSLHWAPPWLPVMHIISAGRGWSQATVFRPNSKSFLFGGPRPTFIFLPSYHPSKNGSIGIPECEWKALCHSTNVFFFNFLFCNDHWFIGNCRNSVGQSHGPFIQFPQVAPSDWVLPRAAPLSKSLVASAWWH